MIRDSNPVAYWRRLNDTLAEADESQVAFRDAYDFYKSGLCCKDALILKLFGAQQSAPPDLTDAFNRTFSRV